MSKLDTFQNQKISAATLTTAPSGILQRKCACGTHTTAGDKCEECKNKQGILQRKSFDNSEHEEVPPIVQEVLNSPGQPLDASTRAFFESRFAHNFSRVPVSSTSHQLSHSSLTIGAPKDVYEQEANRIADSIMLKEKSETLSANEKQGGKFDLGQVRVHTDGRAAESAHAVNALAYTLGNNIVFGEGQFAPETHWGRRLIAHELTHVAQQSGLNGIRVGKSNAKSALSSVSQSNQLRLQRQVPPSPSTPAPTFSVNQVTYLALIRQAVRQMSGRLVDSETLATTVVPILQAMLSNVIWKDAQGGVHGSGTVQYPVGTGVVLNLNLILNDAVAPPIAGTFTHRGMSDGEMEIFVRLNPDADELAATLYHETLHLISWLINRPTPALTMRSSVRGVGQAGAVGTLDLAHSARQIATVRQWLDALAQSVNLRRAPGAARVGTADLDQLASWLIEEVNVRIETEVFRLAENTQREITSRGTSFIIMQTSQNTIINRARVDRYVFDYSHVFLPTDRAGLTATDQQTLATLTQILEGIFQSRVSRRFNPLPYLVGRGIPRAQFRWTPPPLTPPTFRPLPIP
jgi:hypothetical protein